MSAEADGSAAASVAKASGNTLDVTIHRFAPTSARHVRLSITAPQSAPSNPAARIYELEVYPR